MMETVQVRLLGPVDVTIDGIARPLSGLRRKTVLAAMGVHHGETISAERLIDLVWGCNPPATAGNTLQSHVSYLRRTLGDRDAIVARPPGYALTAGTDIAEAAALIRQGEQATHPAEAARQLRAALDLWRGEPLADVAGPVWLHEPAARLAQMRLEALEALIETRLELGEHGHLVRELEQLAEQHPYREHVHHQLMLALYRSGRQADALAAYQRLRRSMARELGLDPGPALRDLEAAVLRQDSALDPPQPPITISTEPVPRPVPAQLPLAAAAFAGRTAELARLDAVLADRLGSVIAIAGTAGVGKTTLALHWAHTVAPRFPDGQLYVNLRGFDPGGSAMDPAEALRGFLDAFGVPADRIPATLDARAALYRSVLAGRRVLIVIDNARDEEHARPLLPGSTACVAVVTSRNQLTGMVAAEAAQPVTLKRPSDADARDMLTRRLGHRRVAAEPEAVDEIVARCARLPLALAVAASYAATDTDLPLAVLAGQLRDAAAALDAFHSTDVATNVRSVFSWSYATLTADAARLFRCLGTCPGPDISLTAAASLAGRPVRGIRPLLTELTRVHLLSETRPGRYAFHDLLRAYAMEEAHTRDRPADRTAARYRLLDHYVQTGYRAAMLLSPTREPIPIGPPAPDVTVADLTDQAQAMAWFTAEEAAVRGVVGPDFADLGTRGWHLAWTFSVFLDRRGRWTDNAVLQRAGLAAAERAGDREGQAHAHRALGTINVRRGDYPVALDHLIRALDLFEQIDQPAAQAHIHLGFANVAELRGEYDHGLEHANRALPLYRAAGHRSGIASALNVLGWCHAQLGQFEPALRHCGEAIDLFVALDDRVGQAGTWDSLGYLHVALGHPTRAIDCYQRAVDAYTELGDRYNVADAASSLGDVYATTGNTCDARVAWQQAADILDDIGHPDLAAVRAKLTSPGTPAVPECLHVA